jgi:peptidyl-dipeptidase A
MHFLVKLLSFIAEIVTFAKIYTKNMKRLLWLVLFGQFLFSCSNQEPSKTKVQEEVDVYLQKYNDTYQKLLIESAEASWKLNTYILEGDTITSKLSEDKEKAMAEFTGSAENIQISKKYLAIKDQLLPLQVRQLQTILYAAGSNPESAKDIVEQKIKAGNEQMMKLYGFDYQLGGKSVSTNDLDGVLKKSNNITERLAAWNASKEVGKNLKTGLAELQSLRNKSVQALDYKDFFEYQATDYGMTGDEMKKTCGQMVQDIWPLYRELHTWARYELAKKYNQEVPDMIPAHWMPNRWGQDWTELVQVNGLNLDDTLGKKSAEWIVQQGEAFYVSLGFDSLPKSFYEKSSLYPLPANSEFKKTTMPLLGIWIMTKMFVH